MSRMTSIGATWEFSSLWRLRSVPDTRDRFKQGPADEDQNPDLAALMAQPAKDEKREHLGASQTAG
jgi:hypothetical protein